MNTLFLLMAEFETPTIPLEAVRERYFGITTKATAARKAASHDLPVPAFKLGGQRSEYFVRAQDLAEYIDKTAESQKEIWQKINAA